jgi:hypothetical protein
MDLFYLNAKKISVCSMVQNCTSLCSSSVHICAITVHIYASSVHVQRFCVAQFCARVVRCTWVRRNLSISYCVHPSCTKMCNAEPLHIFVQLGCTIVQVSLSETCTHLVQATYPARDWGICHARMHHHARGNTHHPKKPQHAAITPPPDHGQCPPCQALETKR